MQHRLQVVTSVHDPSRKPEGTLDWLLQGHTTSSQGRPIDCPCPQEIADLIAFGPRIVS
jgi:hypothetical protein